MRSIQAAALALAAVQVVHGYVDTSPFFMFSTSELLTSASKLSSAEAITSDIATSLSTCPTDYYIIVSQPGVTAADYRSTSPRTSNTPWLAQRLSPKHDREIRSSVTITDVVGEINTTRWEETLRTHCGLETEHFNEERMNEWFQVDLEQGEIFMTKPWPKVAMLSYHAVHDKRRMLGAGAVDGSLKNIWENLPMDDRGFTSYTVLYTTTPEQKNPLHLSEDYSMEAEFKDLLQQYMGAQKRDLSPRAPKKVGNETLVDGALFERYQFFTPGIFMGGLVTLLLLSILYVGISALSSLSVTYAAFDKDQGQLAKTKAQ